MSGDSFASKGGTQNIAQGDEAIGQQNNVNQTVEGNGCIIAGTGPVHVVQQFNQSASP